MVSCSGIDHNAELDQLMQLLIPDQWPSSQRALLVIVLVKPLATNEWYYSEKFSRPYLESEHAPTGWLSPLPALSFAQEMASRASSAVIRSSGSQVCAQGRTLLAR